MAAKSDFGLIRAYLRGSDEAFAILFDRHSRSLHAFAYHLTGNLPDAEDLSQSAWLRALRSLGSFTARGSFRAWLHEIALNLYRDERRRSRSPTVELDSQHADEDPMADPEHVAERGDARRELRAALAGLEPEHREVLVLHKIQGLKYREIAQTLRCPVGTVKSRLHYAMAALRSTLGAARAPQEVYDDVHPMPDQSECSGR